MANQLPPKRAAFVREYLVDLNAAQAARRAGYSEKTANKIAWELLREPDVKAAIDAGKQERAERVELRADDVVRELLAIARVDIGEAFDESGALKKLSEMSPEVRRAISSVEPTELGMKVKFWDKPRALEMLGKHLKLFTERHEHTFEGLTDEQLEARYQALLAKAAVAAADEGDAE